MSSGTSTPSAQQPDSKPRVTNACEACRASKVKCIASSQLGICQRCLESKRECFFKTGPRTRRPRQSKQNKLSATPVVPPPPAPPKTFTIDIPLAMEEDPNDIYDSLREAHEQYIDDLLPKDSADSCPYAGSLLHSTSSAATPSSSNSTRPISSFTGQPQFNIESATQLLEAFRKMQPYFPLISLPEDADVASLAKDRPFELLAILASATGSKSLQGHSLYDEEFRKILALKFVAGGERTLDLLLGLLIYCAWYPFHLRPRSKQLTQYLRMATDIVHDLELDQQPEEDQFVQPTIDEERSRGLRAYLGCFYLVSGRANMWSKQTSMPFTPWTAACCEMLENAALLPSDRAFTWMIRFQHMNEGVMGLRKLEKDASQDEYQIKLLVKGMESQIREWTGKISREVSSTVTLTLCRLFTETFLYGAPLLKFPTPRSASGVVEVIDVQRLVQAVSPLQQFLDRCVSLPLSEFGNFCSLDWGRLICSIILCFRLSFPLEKCPQWNATAFRQRVNFEYYLSRLCQDDEGSAGHQSLTPTTARTADVRSASQVILEVVRRKFQKRMELLMAAPPSAQPISSANLDRTMKGCPVLDGSLDQYFQVWDETFVDPSMVMPAASDEKSANPPTGQPAVFHDLWATMTMSWADDGSDNMDMNFGSQ